MIHPLQQSVTWCKCRTTLMAGLLVSFTYVQGYIAWCYENKQLTFTLVEDCVFNATTSNYSIIKTFVRLTYLVECRFRKLLVKYVWIIIIQSKCQSAHSHESSISHSWLTVVWVLLTRKHFHLTQPGQYMLFAQEALHVASKLIVLDN